MNEPLANPGSPEGLSERSRAASDDRKLIAIIYADMVGYSRLVAIDDANTLWRFSALRRDLIGPAVHDHAGRIINVAGDSFLIAFDSIENAVRCAITVQQRVPTTTGNTYRIGRYVSAWAST